MLRRLNICTAAVMAVSLALWGCGTGAGPKEDSSVSISSESSERSGSRIESGKKLPRESETKQEAEPAPEISVTEKKLSVGGRSFKFAEEDSNPEWDPKDSVIVHLADSGCMVDDEGGGDSGGITLSEDGTVSITEEGTYVFDGALSDGKILVDVKKSETVRLVFRGVDIRSASSAPVDGASGKVILILEGGTENRLSDNPNQIYRDKEEEEPNGTLFCKDDLTITGGGSLTVDAAFNNAVISKDELRIMDGIFHINSANHGLKGNDALLIRGGTITVNSRGNGLKSDLVTAVLGGDILVENSEEGIEGETVLFDGGTVRITSGDDGINASADKTAVPAICITGGDVTVDAEGDGIDSNGNIYMTGGRLMVFGPQKGGNGALDYDVSFQISGGTLAAFGPGDMDQQVSPSSPQPAVQMRYGSVMPAGTKVSLKNEAGEEICQAESAKPFRTVVLSAPELVLGETYTLETGTDSLTFVPENTVGYLDKDGIHYGGS